LATGIAFPWKWSALRFAVLHTNNLIPWGIAFSCFFPCYDDACVVGLRKKRIQIQIETCASAFRAHVRQKEKLFFAEGLLAMDIPSHDIIAWGHIGIESIIASTTAPG
jgi:hypothetical protein